VKAYIILFGDPMRSQTKQDKNRLCQDVVSIITLILGVVGFLPSVMAQVEVDDTLGAEQSRITNRSSTDLDISGGATRSENLFHSFLRFTVAPGVSIYFLNSNGARNIITRVTGGEPSNIFGTLGVTGGDANLFLMNPSGILFGSGARLDLQGSFLGTTANAFQFGNQGVFSASNPAPVGALTVSPSALLFNQANLGSIQSQPSAELQVSSGASLTLVGGDILLDNASLLAPGGRIELAGFTNTGVINLIKNGNMFRLDVPGDVQRSNIWISRNSSLNVRANGNGEISINAQNLRIEEASKLQAGIEDGQFSTQDMGNIIINTTGNIFIDGTDSEISNRNYGTNNRNRLGGDINLRSESLSITNGAQISVDLFGSGRAGNINAFISGSVYLDGVGESTNGFRQSSGIFGLVRPTGEGTGGNIFLNADSLSLRNGASLYTSTQRERRPAQPTNAGNILISANDIRLDGVGKDNFPSSIYSSVGDNSNRGRYGNAGRVDIQGQSLSITNGARLDTSTYGQGDAGQIDLNISNQVSLDGINEEFRNNADTYRAPIGIYNISSGIFNRVDTGATGNSGSVDLDTGSLLISRGAVISTRTDGRGNAGDIRINISGNASFDGIAAQSDPSLGRDRLGRSIVQSSGVFSYIGQSGQGDGGEIDLTARSLQLTDGATIYTSTRREGNLERSLNAGDVLIQADTITLNGIGRDGFPSSIYSSIGDEFIGYTPFGNSGDITLTGRSQRNVQSISITDGARVNVGTYGTGDAGNIDILANSISLNQNSNLSSTVVEGAVGNGGNITLQANSLMLNDNSTIAARTDGQGNAGNITIRDANIIDLSNNSDITASTDGQGAAGNITIHSIGTVSLNSHSEISSAVEQGGSGNGGNIRLNTRILELDASTITASTEGTGNAGNINVRSANRINLNNRSEISSAVEQGGSRNGGNIRLNTRILELDASTIAASTEGMGNAGNINVRSANRINLNNRSEISSAVEQGGSRNGGNIRFNIRTLELDASRITARTNGQGRAGNITINRADMISLDRDSALTTAVGNMGRGRGGDITINRADSLNLANRSNITARSSGDGRSGDINIHRLNSIDIDRNSSITTATSESGSGRGGDINIDTRNLDLDRSTITAQSQRINESDDSEVNRAGNITVNSNEQLNANDSSIQTRAPRSTGGSININRDLYPVGRVLLNGNSDIVTDSERNGGSIYITGNPVIARDDSDIRTRSTSANGGSIDLGNSRAFYEGGLQENVPGDPNNNDRVNFNTEGALNTGTINQPDTSVLLNSLATLEDSLVNPDSLLTNSCIARTRQNRDREGSFIVTGSGGFPTHPGEVPVSPYPTGEVRSLSAVSSATASTPTPRAWKPGDPIVEPQDIRHTSNNRRIASHECSEGG
jgi:filamentous hemagglutinin family protein